MEAGEPGCDESICIKSDPFSTYKKYMNKGKGRVLYEDSSSSSSNTNNQADSANNGSQFQKNEPNKESKEFKDVKSVEVDDYHACPNTRDSLGFFTWNFLHTMAIYYPETPSNEQKDKMKGFITGFAEFYPCRVCAHHLRNDIKKSNIL